MADNNSVAELALQRKYALLKQKKLKQQQQQQQQRKASTSNEQRPPSSGDKPKVDPVRQAAIEALRKRQAAQNGGGGAVAAATTPSAAAAEDENKDVKKKATSIKLKFFIPKKEQAPPAVAAAVAAAAAAPSIAIETSSAGKTGVDDASKSSKGGLKRPAIRRAPGAVEARGGDEPAAKRVAHTNHENTMHPPPPNTTELPPLPRLFVGDLPDHFTSETLFAFFSSFREVEEARVVPGYCYGFVTFTNHDDAQAILDFQSQQSFQVEDRELHMSWARNDSDMSGGARGWDGGGGGGGRVDPHIAHPRIQEARAAAAQVAEQIDHHDLAAVNLDAPPPFRNLVSYDDL